MLIMALTLGMKHHFSISSLQIPFIKPYPRHHGELSRKTPFFLFPPSRLAIYGFKGCKVKSIEEKKTIYKYLRISR